MCSSDLGASSLAVFTTSSQKQTRGDNCANQRQLGQSIDGTHVCYPLVILMSFMLRESGRISVIKLKLMKWRSIFEGMLSQVLCLLHMALSQ